MVIRKLTWYWNSCNGAHGETSIYSRHELWNIRCCKLCQTRFDKTAVHVSNYVTLPISWLLMDCNNKLNCYLEGNLLPVINSSTLSFVKTCISMSILQLSAKILMLKSATCNNRCICGAESVQSHRVSLYQLTCLCAMQANLATNIDAHVQIQRASLPTLTCRY